MTLTCLSNAEDKIRASVSCPGYQTAFGGSCYEFVDLQHTFFNAQAWCEQRDGHLAFIPDKETQHFIQTLMDPKRDVWLGVAPSTSPNLQYSSTVEGALSWLDGSHLTYSNWVSSPQPGEECGHILRDSGFQWEATRHCNKKLHFICQFDSGRSIVCAGCNTTLQCGSGQVLMIDRSFYGRKNLHYCRSTFSPPTTTTEHKCGWVDVVETLTAHCSGRQICQIAPVVDSFVEPCPHLGSYLSVDYHCKDGLSLSVGTVAAVYDDVTINVKWLLHLQQDNLSCKLSTGDGHVIYLLSPQGLESSVVHRYTHPSTFVLVVECITRDVHITAQKIITIQEPIIEFGVIRCYAGKLSFHATDCKALWGEPFQIQIEVKAGTNVTYRVQSDDMLLSGLSVLRGNIPQNITVTPQMMTQHGPGCHQLTLYASNMVTFPEVSAHLQMCELEKVARLEATVLTERDDCPDSPDITVGVSLEQGAPVLLLFSLSGDNSSYSETREMNTSKEIFQIGHPIQGSVQMKVRAWNVFSSLEVDVDMFAFCGKDSVSNGHDDHFLRPGKKQIRVVRSPMKAIATPSYSVPTKDITITLSISDAAKLNDPKKRYEWACQNPCRCQGNFEGLTYDITERCLPDPLQYFNLTCTEGCNPIKKNKDAKIKMDCKGQQCPQIVWNIEDLRDDKNWPAAKSKGLDVTVVITSADVVPLYHKYIIKTSSSTEKEEDSKEKDSKEEDSKEKDSKEEDSKEKDSKEKDSKEEDSKEEDSKEKDSNEKDSKEEDSKEKDSKEKDSKEKDSKEEDSKEEDSKEKDSKEKDSKEEDSKEKDSKEKDSKEEDSKEKDSKEKDSKEKDSKEEDSKEKDSKEKDSKEEDSKEKDSKEKDSKEEDSKEKDSKEEDSKEKDIKEKDSKEEDSKEEDSKEKKSKEKDSKEEDSKEEDSPEETTAGPASTSPGTITDITATPTTTDTGDTSPPVTTNNFDSLKCSISPQRGTILDAFNITCNTEVPCSDCQYCFKTDEGKHLRCSNNSEVKAVFLPLGDSSSNYKLNIKATANNGSFVASTTVTAEVLDYTAVSSSSVDDLKASVENALVQLKEHGVLSGETVGQIFSSVANKLNAQSDESEQADRQKLREKMLDIMNNIVKAAPINTPDEVQATTRGLTAVVQKGTELSTSAQEEASLLFAALSSSLLHMNITNSEENINEIHTAASTIVEGISNILHYSSSRNVSDALLLALSNTQSALLAFKDVHQRPTIIQQAHIGVFVHRVTPGSLHTESINIPNSSSPSFSLPKLPPDVLPSDEPVDIRMLSVDKNPFSWNERGNISGQIGALSLTTTDGSDIPVENLSEDVKILLPRPVGEQVNISVLDLGNYSTTTIDIPVADNTLVLKMVPSNDPLPFKLLLGYMAYPTETNYVAMTEMPHQGAAPEERYTWLLDPKDLKGNTGMHYLVVRPIVGPGIKSINASLTITSITTACKFWNKSKLDWSSYGCRVGVETTHLVTVCLCNHLTFFGSSFFVTPNLVDPSRTAELFATFAENPVVVCFVGSLFVAYLLVVVWARRKDIQDTAKVKVTVLEDNDPMDEYRYLLSVRTGHRGGASTSSQVTITLLGAEGNSEPHHLTDPKKRVFERGAVDVFLLATPFSLGDLQGIRLWHNNSGSHPSWYVGNVVVQDLQTEQKWHFLCNSWLAIDLGDCSLDKVFPGSTEVDLKRFSNLFFMKTSKDFSDGHLWYSVISRPPSSTFTCVQRVSCCFSLLLCTMLTSIMFYGIPTDPSEQTMDLGHFEFSWQQFMIGVQSSLIMFPVNILIVSIFRNTRPRETSCCKHKTEKPDTMEQTSFSQANTNNMNVSVTLDSVIKDITRIAHSLSKTVKSNVPCTEFKFGPGQQVDINAVLSVVEDFIKQNNKTSDTTLPKTQSFCNPVQPQLPEASASMHPGSTVEGIQKKSNKTQYLYRQLCHIDKELSLLGPSGFPTQHSYSQALQQVQGMKGSLEDQLFTFSCAKPDELTQSKVEWYSFTALTCRLNPADSTDGDGVQKKRVCCHGGLPWWFIFVGWLLVIASSVVSGYFTMLYGLKFGKERSVSWLVSMIISFFQSILVIQPLKVLLLAVFFALVIKKVDEEDFENVEFDRNLVERKEQQMVRKNSNLYKPPPPADVEKMRRNKIMEQKAFALLKEILTYMGFMWMLLLVAYGQRDPNAFFLNQHIRNSFSRGISDSMSLGEVFTWANTSLLSNLFGVYPGFITDGNSKLVGNARLRQLRVQKDSCEIADSMLQFVPDCHAPYSWEAEDIGSYDLGWNHTVRDNISASTSSPWTYQTQAQLRAHPVWGKMVLYRGGGFVAELGPDSQNASSTLEYLFRNTWLDIYTRAIIVEFTVYNANVNLFCIVTLLLETTAVGAFQFHSELQSVRLYQSTGGLHVFVMAAEIIYLLFILYYMFLQGKLMKQQQWAYFKSKWNLLELTIILLSWSTVAVFIQRTLLGNRDMTYYQNHKDQFASFYETATVDSVLQYLIAFLVLLATFKLWHLLRLNPKMNMITSALRRAWSDISGFLVIIVIMLVAYSVASNVIYGWRISTYRTFTDALLTIISLQVGIFNYDEVLDSTPVLGGLLFGSCVVFMTFVVLNLLLSVILVAFNQEQIYHKPSDEEEIVDLMLKKICSLFGIRYKDTNDNRGPDVNVASGLTLNNSKNILNNSSIDVNIYQKSDDSENL
ncbi:polycystic kidney disease protein 1-like 2 [Epinephelus fuscoguttatus]|uniref:polycystic kidney disease protein 1-like 2 n=1 Tax=Epinephelus fuscoguttatus TaxID=293821 RepID=UPI0020D0EF0D|nr:polycystic kidney disease protein 1-like 2 [Epinephelus fuscoguttatus]